MLIIRNKKTAPMQFMHGKLQKVSVNSILNQTECYRVKGTVHPNNVPYYNKKAPFKIKFLDISNRLI